MTNRCDFCCRLERVRERQVLDPDRADGGYGAILGTQRESSHQVSINMCHTFPKVLIAI
jgi:hypothetical protein